MSQTLFKYEKLSIPIWGYAEHRAGQSSSLTSMNNCIRKWSSGLLESETETLQEVALPLAKGTRALDQNPGRDKAL